MTKTKLSKTQTVCLIVIAIIGTIVFYCGSFIAVKIIHTYVVKPYYIPSEAMRNTLQIGDMVFINRYIYRHQKPKKGDIIVFEFPGKNSLVSWDMVKNQTTPEKWENKSHIDFIERCIATENDEIDIRNNKVYLNGKELKEPYIMESMESNTIIQPNITFPYKVPEGFIFAMGDNVSPSDRIYIREFCLVGHSIYNRGYQNVGKHNALLVA